MNAPPEGRWLASLPMYDLEPVRAATDRWWAGLARALTDRGVAGAPAVLDRGGDRYDAWLSPRLLLAQTCGYPLAHRLAGHVRVVAVPCYRARGCEGWRYSSALVVRADDPARDLRAFAGAMLAANAPDSFSGWHVLAREVGPLAGGEGFFADVLWTGTHAASIAAVRRGDARVCAVDCVTHALLARHAPDALDGTRVLARTAPAPALPYVTRADVSGGLLARLRRALAQASGDPALAATREALLIDGFSLPPEGAYDFMRTLPRGRITVAGRAGPPDGREAP